MTTSDKAHREVVEPSGATISSEVARNLSRLIMHSLGSAPLPRPRRGEREPRYTARVILPRVTSALASIRTRTFVVGGDGAAAARIGVFLGRDYNPDVAIMSGGARALALEVKIVRGDAPNASVASAVGQALIYRLGGYAAAGAVLVDPDRVLRPLDRSTQQDLESLQIRLLVPKLS